MGGRQSRFSRFLTDRWLLFASVIYNCHPGAIAGIQSRFCTVCSSLPPPRVMSEEHPAFRISIVIARSAVRLGGRQSRSSQLSTENRLIFTNKGGSYNMFLNWLVSVNGEIKLRLLRKKK